MEEVISQQPAEILEFLTATAVVDRFCPAMCDHILADSLGQIDSRRLIREIERENLFLVPLDRDRNWYRYHHLFKKPAHASI